MTPTILADNRFWDGQPQVSETPAAGCPLANLFDRRSYTAWTAGSTATQSVYVDCGVAKSANCLGIVNHNLYSVGASFLVYGSTDGGSWNAMHTAYVVPRDTAVLYLFNSASYRYWAVNITGASAPPSVGELMLGTALAFPYPPNAPFTPFTDEVEAETTTGKTGNLLGVVTRYTRLGVSAKFNNLDRSWVHTYYLPFWRNHAAKGYPFFWGWDLTTFPEHVFYVTLKDPAKLATPVSMLAYYDSLTLEMTGLREG